MAATAPDDCPYCGLAEPVPGGWVYADGDWLVNAGPAQTTSTGS